MTRTPRSWTPIHLGEAGKWLSGGTPSTSNPAFWNGDIPWISSGSLTNFRVSDSGRRVTDLGSKAGTRLVPPGTILMVVRGMSLKTEFRMGITQRTVAFGQDCKALVAADGIDPKFLAYAISSRSPHILNIVDEAGHGTGRLNTDQLFAVELNIPPMPEQLAIAEVLGALDDKIAVNTRAADLALTAGDGLLGRALVGLERHATLGELAGTGALELSDGYRTKRDEHGSPGLRILRAGDVKAHRITPTGADFVSFSFVRQMGRKVSEPGDIILTTKGTVGRVAVVPDRMEQVVYSPQVCYFRVQAPEQIDPGFLAAWFRGPDLARQTTTVMFKSDMAPYISLADIRSLRVPMPDPVRQREIGVAQRSLLDLFASKQRESDLLAEIRDVLLPQLMSGKIRVKDAERVVEGAV